MSEQSERLPLFAVTAPGLEELAVGELAELGIEATAEPGGAGWLGTREEMYRANLWLRTASRVLLRVGEFKARTFFELERHARKLPWTRFVALGQAVELRVTCRKSKLYHEGAVAERMLAAVGRALSAPPPVPSVKEEEDEGAAAQLFVVRFLHDRCTVSVDTSGALLHRRGYRQAVAKAPLRETLAAAVLRASGWTGQAPLLDPMCGSGTLLIEGALVARRVAPGLANAERAPRNYAFMHWPDFDEPTWEAVVRRAREQALPRAEVPIIGSDRDAGAVQAARANAERAGVAADVEWSVRSLSALEPPPGAGWLVSNPPYGMRVGESAGLRDLYAALGRVTRERLPGWILALLSADPRLEAQVGVPLRDVVSTRNGGIPVRVVVGVGHGRPPFPR